MSGTGRRTVGMAVCLVLAMALVESARAQSAFPPLPPRVPPLQPAFRTDQLSLTKTPKPGTIKLHDLINIAITEKILHQTNARANHRKQREFELDFAEAMVLLPGHRLRGDTALALNPPGFDIEAENTIRNTMQWNRRDTLEFAIQAQVVEIKPNGNLVLEAHGMVEVNNEVNYITISGICSPGDVVIGTGSIPGTATRMVSSEKIANKRVRLDQVGPTRDALRRGWLTRMIDMFGLF